MLYVYQDMDHGEVEVFDSLEKAKAHVVLNWGKEQDWEDCGDHIHDLYSDYVSIYFREIK